MRRMFLMIGAAACVALPLGDLALAQGRGKGRGGDGGGPPRMERPYSRPDRPPGRQRFEDGRSAPPPYERGEPRRFGGGPRGRWDDDDRGAAREADRRRFDAPPRAFAPQGARRGGYLPDRFRGGVVEDYRRFRLRPPPHGYAWVRVGGGFALVSEGTGQVFDVIPD